VVSHFYDSHQHLIDEVKGHLNHKNEHMQQQQQTHERSDDFETKKNDIEKFRKKKNQS
jgi:hypothetical protein